ncbi:A-macroglobulin complement component [Myxococcus stipitatus DSM 14675]|uniref:A-macroglobulin complement component n=1 Tax=Myxococcus stipitatus (strain DSM 14675 / JCM 12634 / Mx s8) TaxID=1278073 RepID=L7UKY4_MYXSD|nr:alpha-2-macroglobulin family protein [Myxococcus stipitatus]AGC48683.1 A-macroglobulin complement component [Myxococcus stipitatus DSM 14675]
MTLPVPRLLGVLAALGLAAPSLLPAPGLAAPRNLPTPQADRPNTFITTDKPLYRPGDQVLMRALYLSGISRKPYTDMAGGYAEIRGPLGEVVWQGYMTTRESVWGMAWTIPPGQSGGEYTLRVTSAFHGMPIVERKFDVRAYRAPRLKSQIEFLRDGYGPGDTVSATLDVKRAEGGIPEGAKVSATALVDGATAAQVSCVVDAQGLCSVRFALPANIARGEGTLAFTIQDGGVVETAAKTIPILLQTLDLAFYPEGGDLVAGVPSRVYFEARTPAQKPADLTGTVIDVETGMSVLTVRSEHEGRGRFALTPRAGAKYALRITAPAGIRKTFPLPAVKQEGAVLRSTQDVVPQGQHVKLALGTTNLSRVTVTLSQRDVRIASAVVDPREYHSVILDPGDADGVLIATAWDADGRPLAERLVFRQPSKDLEVSLTTNHDRTVPGAKVELTAKTTRDGKPVSALVMLTVTDDAMLQLKEKREQAPELPVMVLLEPEVRELADAQLYLDRKNPKAPLAVDLLLGTQGWRRFAFAKPTEFLARGGDVVDRILLMSTTPLPPLPAPAMPVGAVARLQAAPAKAQPPADQAMLQLEQKELDDGAGLAVNAPMPMAVPPKPPAEPVAEKVAKMEAPAFAPIEEEIRARRDEAAPMGAEAPRAWANTPMVREYAHLARPKRKPQDRVDFAETLYWNAGVRTDARTGEVRVSFATSDSVTTFKAFAGAVGADGALGSTVKELESVQPFYAEPKLPLEVTSGDVVQLPVALVNGTDSTLTDAQVKAEIRGDVKFTGGGAMSLHARERGRQLLSLTIGQESKPVEVKLIASANNYSDTVTRTLAIKAQGFPAKASFGGMVSPNRPAVHTVVLPEQVVPGSIRASIVVYPSPLANMTEGLARLIQEPSGCFEQTSSTTYPMTMAQQYFLSHSGVSPDLVSSAREKLDRGHDRLVSFETKERGYEWFGEAPGHEALTAFGLLHFTDMKQVRTVNAGMMERTRGWLMGQRDGKGGFNRKRRALHVWLEDPDTSNAYIVWALLESASSRTEVARELAKEIASVKKSADTSSNSYVVALAANVLSLAGDGEGARALMARLAKLQNARGEVAGGTQSIVGSSGDTLRIETTALAALAWLREPEQYMSHVVRTLKYLAESNDGGRYGATQSTVLALRVINTYDQAHGKKLPPGQVYLYVEGRPVGEPVRFDGSTREALKLADVSGLLGPGGRKVELRMEGGEALSYSMEVTYSAVLPQSSQDTPVSLEVAMAKREFVEGEPTEARVMVANRTGQHLPTAVAIFGVPGGMDVRHDQLKELVKRKVVDAYEVLGRDVVLYWRGMEPRKRIDVPLSLVATVPGTYTGPASRAYLYYTDEHKVWSEGVKVSISPKS